MLRTKSNKIVKGDIWVDALSNVKSQKYWKKELNYLKQETWNSGSSIWGNSSLAWKWYDTKVHDMYFYFYRPKHQHYVQEIEFRKYFYLKHSFSLFLKKRYSVIEPGCVWISINFEKRRTTDEATRTLTWQPVAVNIPDALVVSEPYQKSAAVSCMNKWHSFKGWMNKNCNDLGREHIRRRRKGEYLVRKDVILKGADEAEWPKTIERIFKLESVTLPIWEIVYILIVGRRNVVVCWIPLPL